MGNARYDIVGLRKKLGMSQKDMANRLGIRQSFLSSIETGKSPFPIERISLLEQLCFPEHLDMYVIHDTTPKLANEISAIPAGSNEMNMLTELLNYFHSQAHREQDEQHQQMHAQMYSFQERNDRLTEKNEALQEKIEHLNAKIDNLREELHQIKNENLHLKEKLLEYQNNKGK